MRRLSPLESTYTKDRATEICLQTLDALGFDLNAQPNIKLDLDDRPQKSPRACVIASDPPKIVHLITRAQGGLHDYQAFLHEAGHALHYARLRPAAAVHLPPHLPRPRADRDLLVHRRGDLARARVARAVLRPLAGAGAARTRKRRRSSRRCSTAATRRSSASSSTSGRASTATAATPDVYERCLTEATGIRYQQRQLPLRHGRRLLLGRLPARVDPVGAAARPPRSRGRRATGGGTRRPASCCATSSARARSRRARRSPAASASIRSTRSRCCTRSAPRPGPASPDAGVRRARRRRRC